MISHISQVAFSSSSGALGGFEDKDLMLLASSGTSILGVPGNRLLELLDIGDDVMVGERGWKMEGS